MKLRQTAIRPGCVAMLAAMYSPLVAQEYTVRDLGTLGGNSGVANAISENGTVAGWAQLPTSVKHAVIWDQSGIVDLGAPDGFIVSEAFAVNDAGQVAAIGDGGGSTYQSYAWEDGVWTPLGVLPGLNETIVSDIDPAGRIVGRSFVLGPGPPDRAFRWGEGVFKELGTFGDSTQAHAINRLGQIAGWSYYVEPQGGVSARAFRWQHEVMTDLGVLPGEDYSQGLGINDRGDVVGSSWHITIPQFFSADQATLWRQNGEIVDLGLTPGPEACADGFPFYTDNIARAVNNCGQVVGHAQCVASGGAKAAFLWQDGVMHNLNDLIPADADLELISALDINNAGQIVGIGLMRPNGQHLRAFLLEPVVPQTCVVADFDVDGDVDTDDFAILAACLNGPAENTPPPGCDLPTFESTDLDGDNDVDLDDFALFELYDSI